MRLDTRVSSSPLARRLRKLTTAERIEEALAFLDIYASEQRIAVDHISHRKREIVRELRRHDYYEHTPEELAFGARVAWRNHANCIGRLHWKSLEINDYRSVRDPDVIAAKVFDHMAQAKEGGRIRSTISIFAPVRGASLPAWIENRQVTQYAGYIRKNARPLGDPINTEFTRTVTALGWERPSVQGHFDLLPLLIRDEEGHRHLYDIPAGCVDEIHIEHPTHPGLSDLGLKWYSVPFVSDMILTIGGIDYPCAPFNGWYMATEIASRNFADEFRYDLLQNIATAMGVNTEDRFWKDTALVELNRSVVHSFDKAGATIVDHHTASAHYVEFMRQERASDRVPSGEWGWIVPPLSSASCPVFHLPMTNLHDVPNFYRSRVTDGAPLRVSHDTEHRERSALRVERLKRRWRQWRRRG
jgi:nitric-oxide synthase